MTFFNKKEDVMHIELTPHGRKLLSEGKMMPYGYSFFDDDIIYESQKVGSTENNSQTKTRILVDTPSLKPQTNYRGVETELNNQLSVERDNIMLLPIGSNKPSSLKVNAWEVRALEGEISSSTTCLSSSSPIVHIPQIECEMDFKMRVKNVFTESPFNAARILESQVFDDDYYVELETPNLLLYLLERNGFQYTDSLDVEVFMFSDDEQTLTKLDFLSEGQKVMNDLFVSNQPETGAILNPEKLVQTYFDLRVDEEIPPEILCEVSHHIENHNIYLGFDLECDENADDDGLNVNLYETEVEDYEDCD